MRDDTPLPGQSDHAILRWIAMFCVSDETEEKRRKSWQPWVSLPLEYHYWLETFFEEIFRAGLDREGPFFNQCLTEIFSFLTTECWLKATGAGFRPERVALHLIGRGNFGSLAQRWNANRSHVAVALAPLWETWLRAAYTWTCCFAGFCDLLQAPAFGTLRLTGLKWMADLELVNVLQDDENQDSLVRFLECVESTDAQVLSDRTHRDAFETLLATCVGFGNKRAIILAGKLGVRGSSAAATEIVPR